MYLRNIGPAAGEENYSVVIRFSALGDVILTLPVLGPLAEATSTRVIFLTRELYGNLIKRHPDVAAVYTIPAKGAGGPGDVKRVCGRINAEFACKVCLAVDLHRVRLSGYALSLVRSDEKTTYRKYSFRRLLLMTLRVDLLPRPTKRVSDMYADALKPWGVAGPDNNYRLSVDATRKSRLLAELGLSTGFVAVFPGAIYPTRAWPAEKYAELVRRLTEAGTQPAVFGAPAEREICDTAAGSSDVPNLAGEVALDDLPEVLSAAGAVVTNDSAAMHLASVLGVPAVVMFGPTSPRFGFVPWSEGSKSLYADLSCSPCSRHGGLRCWRRRRYCFDEISVDLVFAAVNEARGL